MLAGMSNSRSSSSSHCSVWMLNSIVRDALLTSVTCAAPPVSFQTSQRVDGAERELAGLGPRARARDVVENPRDLAPREVGVDHETRALADERVVAVGPEAVAEVRRAPVLPDDGVVDRLAGLAIPDDGRLALVGDADGRDVARPQVRAAEDLDGHGDLRRPDLLRIVLDPAGLRKDLLELALRDAGDGAVVIEEDGARAGGALIEGEDVLHRVLLGASTGVGAGVENLGESTAPVRQTKAAP